MDTIMPINKSHLISILQNITYIYFSILQNIIYIQFYSSKLKMLFSMLLYLSFYIRFFFFLLTNLSIDGRWGLRAVYRDSEGAILAAATWLVPGSNDPTLVEAYALYKAILLAIDCGFFEVICESDNACVIRLLNDASKNPRLYIGNLIQGILCNRGSFRGISYRSIGHEANKVAHCLASLAHQEPNKFWLEEAPPCIIPLLIRDLIH
jgi:hypothetical protein